MIIRNMNHFRFILCVTIPIISFVTFGQNFNQKSTINERFIDHSECISTTIFSIDENDLMVAIIDEDITIEDKNTEHYYIPVSIEKNITFFEVLTENGILDEVYIFNDGDEGGYKELNTDKIVSADDVELIFQMDFGSPCHNDGLFILISNKEVAEKILLQLATLFNQNKGLLELKKHIKTN